MLVRYFIVYFLKSQVNFLSLLLDTYLEGKSKEGVFEEFSSIESCVEASKQKSEKRKRPRVFFSSDDDIDEQPKKQIKRKTVKRSIPENIDDDSEIDTGKQYNYKPNSLNGENETELVAGDGNVFEGDAGGQNEPENESGNESENNASGRNESKKIDAVGGNESQVDAGGQNYSEDESMVHPRDYVEASYPYEDLNTSVNKRVNARHLMNCENCVRLETKVDRLASVATTILKEIVNLKF